MGHRCIGARVNGRLTSLDSTLTSGDTVEVFTSKVAGAGPSRDWLKIVVTPRARNKIRQWFSRERREDAIENGRDELTKALRREGLPVQKVAASAVIPKVAEAMNYADLDALHAAIGEGHVSAKSVAQRIGRELRGGDHEEQLPATARQPRPARRKQTVGVHVEGLDDLTWVLLDYGDFVVHVFHEDARRFYELERLWADVPKVAWAATAPAAASAPRP